MNEAAYVQTVANQRLAAHPEISVWVAANAGTVKTHVLTQRVIRLLLAGVEYFLRFRLLPIRRRIFISGSIPGMRGGRSGHQATIRTARGRRRDQCSISQSPG